MHRKIVTTLFVLSVGSRAWAQDDSPLATPEPPAAIPVETTTTTRPSCDDTTPLPRADSACPPRGARAIALRIARIGVEAILGAGFGAATTVAGAYVGLMIDVTDGREAGVGLALGTAIGSLGVAPAVWVSGYAMGGDGSFGWTLLGNALGSSIGALAIGVDASPASIGIAAIFPVLGAIVGYELSSHARRSNARSPQTSALLVAPVVTPTYVGLTGRF